MSNEPIPLSAAPSAAASAGLSVAPAVPASALVISDQRHRDLILSAPDGREAQSRARAYLLWVCKSARRLAEYEPGELHIVDDVCHQSASADVGHAELLIEVFGAKVLRRRRDAAA